MVLASAQLAAQWYRRARELGHPDAAEAIQRLTGS